MAKSAQAFRTIREVADWLDVAAHVLRFWESKFSQIKPVKRAGGRRYYRPADMELVGGIKVLLHERGMTIRGVQKLISDEGLSAVTSLSPSMDDLLNDAEAEVIDQDPAAEWEEDASADTDTIEQPDTPEDEGLEAQSDDAQTPDDEEQIADASEAEPQEVAPVDLEAAIEPEAEPVEEYVEPTEEDVEPEVEIAAAPPSTAEPDVPVAATDTPPAPIEWDRAEGRLGALAAMATRPTQDRAVTAAHIAALTQLRDRMAAPAVPVREHS